MSQIHTYAVTDDPDDWGDAPTYDTLDEARNAASTQGACIVELTYTFEDSEFLGGADDFRPVSKRRKADVDALSREALVAMLENEGIACYDDEGDEVLREAVRVNLDDGTIEEDQIDIY